MSIAPTLATHTVGLSAIRPTARVSPMVLSDRLISLAQDADRAGFKETAGKLLVLAHSVLDEPGSAPPACLADDLVASLEEGVGILNGTIAPSRLWTGMPHSI